MNGRPSLSFVVEGAGCENCAARVRAVLEPLVQVREILIDEDADIAVVTAEAADVTHADVEAALMRASEGSGHAYRVAPGSWRVG